MKREDLAETIGIGIHTSLRKFVDSPEAHVAWKAINDMPDKEWWVVCEIVADAILRILKVEEEND